MSKFNLERPREDIYKETTELSRTDNQAITFTREYFTSHDKEALHALCQILKTEKKKDIRSYLRWLLSRDRRGDVAEVCRLLLDMGVVGVKEETELEIVVHVAVDLLQALLRSGLEFHQFLLQTPPASSETACPVERLWDSLVFRSPLCGRSGLRYDHRLDYSERFAYVIIVAMIQASSSTNDSLNAITNMLMKYPIHPMDTYTYGKVFRALVVGGIRPCESFRAEMEGRADNAMHAYYEPYRKWYKDHRNRVHCLKHLARTVVRLRAICNLEVLVSKLQLSVDVAEVILLRDQETMAVINKDDN